MGGSCQKIPKTYIFTQRSVDDNDKGWCNFSGLNWQISEEDSIVEIQNQMGSIHKSKERFTIMKQYNFQSEGYFLQDHDITGKQKRTISKSCFEKSHSPIIRENRQYLRVPSSLGKMERKKKKKNISKSQEIRGILKNVSNSVNSSHSTKMNNKKVSFQPQRQYRTYKRPYDYRIQV